MIFTEQEWRRRGQAVAIAGKERREKGCRERQATMAFAFGGEGEAGTKGRTLGKRHDGGQQRPWGVQAT